MLDGCQDPASEDAWRWFIERYRSYIQACVERLISPRDRAAQAVEEIWSYLFTSSMIASADQDRRFRAYLAGTVRNFSLDWLRRNSSDAVGAQGDDLVGGEDPAAVLEQQELRSWKQQVVWLALQELAITHHDQVRVLRWFYGLPDADNGEPTETRSASWIAEKLVIKPNAVHQMVFRGRKRLRSCIENELRETVRSRDDLDDEMRLVYAVIERENPGLEDQPG